MIWKRMDGTTVEEFTPEGHQRLMWVGDGFSLGRDQIGRSIQIDGRTGTVVDGDAFSIVVKWDDGDRRKLGDNGRWERPFVARSPLVARSFSWWRRLIGKIRGRA